MRMRAHTHWQLALKLGVSAGSIEISVKAGSVVLSVTVPATAAAKLQKQVGYAFGIAECATPQQMRKVNSATVGATVSATVGATVSATVGASGGALAPVVYSTTL